MALRAGRAPVSRAAVRLLVHIQRHRLAVRDAPEVLLAVTAQAVAVGRPRFVEYLADLVRLMAIHAGRNAVRLGLPQPPLDHLAMHHLDAGVALDTGGGHVGAID